MKLISFLVATGFLFAISVVAIPTPTPAFTTSSTMTTVVDAAMPPPTSAPTLMPRSDIEAYCKMLELGLIENQTLRTVTLNRTGVTRIHPRKDMKDVCKAIREGKLTYEEHKIHPGHNKITLKHNPFGDP